MNEEQKQLTREELEAIKQRELEEEINAILNLPQDDEEDN